MLAEFLDVMECVGRILLHEEKVMNEQNEMSNTYNGSVRFELW